MNQPLYQDPAYDRIELTKQANKALDEHRYLEAAIYFEKAGKLDDATAARALFSLATRCGNGFPCQACGLQFDTLNDLMTHDLEAHPTIA